MIDTASVQATLMPKKGRQDRVRLAESPRGTLSSGLSDFRGFPLTVAYSVEINDADFSRARSSKNAYGVDQAIRLTYVKSSRAVFDHARVFHRISGEFADCSFKKIGTDRCGVTGTFHDCDFSGTSFRNAVFSANFVRCRFRNCNLRLAGWASSFDQCEFAGAGIDDLFADIRDVAMSAERITFAVVGSSVLPGETRHY